FSSLTKLHVKNCRGLKYLFTFTTAKTLCVLEELCIANCKSLKEIVAKEGDEYNYENEDDDGDCDELEDRDEGEVKVGDDNEDESETEDEDEEEGEEEEEDESEGQDEDISENEVRGEEENVEEEVEEEDESGGQDEDEVGGEEEDENVDEDEGDDVDRIIFKQLKILELSSLPKFGSFYSGSSTLKFPSLEYMIFTQCPNMKIFRLGDKVSKDLVVVIDGEYPEGDIYHVIMQQVEEERQPADLIS
ncbi:hypothetical protein A2U01_0011480, partial [Trifolium medium]|nr:hypothetical protein [Trifolium medium]